MQATCPNCQATYTIKAAIKPAGRKLQCAKCQHIWKIYPADAPTIPAPAPTATPAQTTPTPPTSPTLTPEPQPDTTSLHTPLPSLESLATLRTTPSLLRSFGLSWFWVLAGATVVATAAMGWLWLQQLIQLTPPPTTAPKDIYARAIPPQPTGLIITGLTHQLLADAQHTAPTLVITGTLTNTTSATLAVPPLAVQVVAAQGLQLARLGATLPSPTLVAGQSLPFRASFHTLPLKKVHSYRAFFLTPPTP